MPSPFWKFKVIKCIVKTPACVLYHVVLCERALLLLGLGCAGMSAQMGTIGT